MARTISGGSRLTQLDQFMIPPAILPQPKIYFQPPGGMHTGVRLDMIPPSMGRLVQNLVIRDGAYKTRDAVDFVGAAGDGEVAYATEILLSNGDSWLIRWTETGLEYYDTGSWVGVLNGTLAKSDGASMVTITGWNDTVVFSTQLGKCWLLSFATVPTLTDLTESPVNVTHLTTFAGRIIASVLGTRIYWTVKNDNTDWTGLGSGFEDLIGSPGGMVDTQCGVVPISDEIAFAIRANRVWQMTQTGNFDAPFAFGQLIASVGSIAPSTLCSLPGAAAFLSKDNVVIVSPSGGKQEVGDPLRRTINALGREYLRYACMVYDPREDELRLSIPDGDGQLNQKVWRYNRKADAWTQDSYQFGIRSISFSRYLQSIVTIDGLDAISGTIDGLPGIIDELGVTDKTAGCIYAMADDSHRVAHDAYTRNNTSDRDTDFAGVYVPGGWRIESGYILPGTSIEKTQVIEVQLEYESEGSQDIAFEYSDDGGQNWTEFDRTTVSDTNDQSLILSVRKHIYRDRIQLAVSCEDSKTIRLIAMHVFTAKGARIADAS